jgi:hypothetical protein
MPEKTRHFGNVRRVRQALLALGGRDARLQAMSGILPRTECRA